MGTRMQLMKKKEQTVQHTNSKLREQILLTYSVQKCSEQNKTDLCHNIPQAQQQCCYSLKNVIFFICYQIIPFTIVQFESSLNFKSD